MPAPQSAEPVLTGSHPAISEKTEVPTGGTRPGCAASYLLLLPPGPKRRFNDYNFLF